VPFLAASIQNPPTSQTRPDVCRATGEVAFAGATLVVIANGAGTSIVHIPSSDGWTYPSWSHDGATLVVKNNASSASPLPCNTHIDKSGTVLQPNIDGQCSGVPMVSMFGGMPAVSPTEAKKIAYAGSPDTGSWGGHNGYDQDDNYIFLNAVNSAGVFTSSPLEPGAPTTQFAKQFQGRAPAWSPDGRWVVFESNRLGGYALFLFDTQNPSIAAVQLTNPVHQAQHAKFYHDGTELICAARPTEAAPFAVAKLDISAFV
jgi:Tol biopolymer transport system component